MLSEGGSAARCNLRYSLAGLEAGTIGALWLLGWLWIAAVWYRRTIWSVPNLLASTFFGEPAFLNGFGRTTFSGLALFFFIYGALGVLFGLCTRRRGSRALVVTVAMVFALSWYYLSFYWIWKHVNPLVALYVPNRPMFTGHVLYGLLLARFPVYRDTMLPAGSAAN